MTQEEIREFIEKEMPQFANSCTSGKGDSILMHQKAFGDTKDDMIRMACAMKYAGMKGRNVVLAHQTK